MSTSFNIDDFRSTIQGLVANGSITRDTINALKGSDCNIFGCGNNGNLYNLMNYDGSEDGLSEAEFKLWAGEDGILTEQEAIDRFNSIDSTVGNLFNLGGNSDGSINTSNISAYADKFKDGDTSLIGQMSGNEAQDTTGTLVAVGEACEEAMQNGGTCSPTLKPYGAEPSGFDKAVNFVLGLFSQGNQ